MVLLMFALQQPYCFTSLRLRFQVAYSILSPNPAACCRRRTVDEYHELGV
ncbi:hypothetical protein EIKCOROL_01869 [Eikenella corrodens ATCC 23834]|uniref:Uncharacterized protein n=1 Tax=Eikenella corrodens ATCC 23834 TaxID=546274 RepID=C0DWW6_EIKCO|nr:hypothetical protein EIKCOROL_01869 [Eikenella corrodens ATCC 23834]